MRYILVICLCALGGGFSASMAWPVSIFRGAVLGACLAAAFPAIDYLKSKGRCRSVWTTALVGACFGLLAGLIICPFKLLIISRDGIIPMLNQPLLLIAVSILYGFFVHLSLAIQNRWQLPAYFAAIFFCHYCRFLFSYPYTYNSLLNSLLLAGLNFPSFALLWYVPISFLLVYPPITPPSNYSNQQGEKVS